MSLLIIKLHIILNTWYSLCQTDIWKGYIWRSIGQKWIWTAPNFTNGMCTPGAIYGVYLQYLLNPLRAYWRMRQKQDLSTSVGLQLVWQPRPSWGAVCLIPPPQFSFRLFLDVLVFAFLRVSASRLFCSHQTMAEPSPSYCASHQC